MDHPPDPRPGPRPGVRPAPLQAPLPALLLAPLRAPLTAPLLALLLALALLAGCTQPGPAEAAPDVSASFYPLAWMAGRIAGPDLRVAGLVPPGVEPHDWEPTPREAERILGSKVVVYNGAGLEPWAARLLPDLRAQGRVLVEAAAGLAGLRGEEAPGALGPDPHVWLDPVLAQGMADRILAGLQAADPANATAHAARAAALRADLAGLDAGFREGLADCASRDVLTTHAAFGYLAARYDFTQHSLSGLSPEAEPSPAAIQRAVDLARELNVTHIFFETLVSPRVAETIAREVGAGTLVLDPIEGLTPDEAARGSDYLDLARQNLDALRTALRCT